MADDYTPSEARVCIDFCTAAVRRGRPDGSFMSMEEADAAFSRWLAAHDAEKRAEWEAEQGEVEWEYGNEQLLHTHVEVFAASSEAVARAQAWLYPIRRRREAGPWLPVPDTTNHESEGKA